MKWLKSAMAYGKHALGAASWGGAALGSKIAYGGPGVRLAAFAGAGALYGGTIGRDPGQGYLGGAMTGALGGAALYGAARYGRSAYTGAMGVKHRGVFSGSQMYKEMARSAGVSAFIRMKDDARMARRFIGEKLTKPINGFRALGA